MTKFIPDTVFPPSDTILELLEERDWNQKEFSERMGYSTKHISELLTGKVQITLETAQGLERVLGASTQFWLNLEINYRNHLARIETQNKCTQWVDWLKQLPLIELKQHGVLPNETLNKSNKPLCVELCLKFFSVSSPEQWQQKYGALNVAFRRSQPEKTDIGAVTTWLRLGEIKAEAMDNKVTYNKEKFKKSLEVIRKMTTESPNIFEPKIKQLCSEAGVAFVMVPSIPKAKVSGAARWLNQHKPLIQLSLFGKTNDKFWFTFFHEAAHILLHADKKDAVYLDNPDKANSDVDYEREANEWAGNILIPEQHNSTLPSLTTKQLVREFSRQIDIHPAIVVGRLQHDKVIPPSWMNEFKEKFEFANHN